MAKPSPSHSGAPALVAIGSAVRAAWVAFILASTSGVTSLRVSSRNCCRVLPLVAGSIGLWACIGVDISFSHLVPETSSTKNDIADSDLWANSANCAAVAASLPTRAVDPDRSILAAMASSTILRRGSTSPVRPRTPSAGEG